MDLLLARASGILSLENAWEPWPVERTLGSSSVGGLAISHRDMVIYDVVDAHARRFDLRGTLCKLTPAEALACRQLGQLYDLTYKDIALLAVSFQSGDPKRPVAFLALGWKR